MAILLGVLAALPLSCRTQTDRSRPQVPEMQLSADVAGLHRVLVDHRGDSSTPGRLLRLLATDALVQLGTELTAAQAEALDTEHALIPSLVLLSRNPRRHLGRLRAIHEAAATGPAGDVWRATGNLLARERAAGFAASLLAALEVKLEITVVNPGQRPPVDGIGVGLGGASASMKVVPAPPGFPPLPRYTLTCVPEAGDVVLAPGKTPVYYRRTVLKPGVEWIDSQDDSFRSDLTRLAWIETMAGARAEPLGFRLESWELIEFESAESYRAAVGRRYAALERGFRALVARLARRRALTGDEVAALRPDIEVRVRDAREPWPGRLPSWSDSRLPAGRGNGRADDGLAIER